MEKELLPKKKKPTGWELISNSLFLNRSAGKNKGAHFAMERLNKFFREFYKKHGTKGYILKCDIKKYFDSIDHRVLKAKLSRIIRDPMDDCIMIHNDKKYLKECLNALTWHIENELLLGFNQKNQLTTIKNGVDYLGFRFYLTDTGKVIRRLRTSSKKRLKRRLKKFQWEYRQEKVKLEDITHSIASYKGHLKHGHTDRLQQKIFHDFVLTKDTTITKDMKETKDTAAVQPARVHPPAKQAGLP